MGTPRKSRHDLSSGRVLRIRSRALDWYRRNRRDLPWRTRPTPYRVWVSEIILQQTRVETAIPYFRAFIRRFPTIRSLASADIDDVLGVWSGLGYYLRARSLHRAAQALVAHHDGKVPRSSEELRALPGVGEYTAGAIRSIAFGERSAAVDGNAIRVIARVQGFKGNPIRAAGAEKIRRWAERLVPRREPGLFNQALMDLGAGICLPRNPRCAHCPLRASCLARKEGTVSSIPPRARVQSRRAWEVSAVIRKNGKVLLARRNEGEVLGGLWELPGGEAAGPERGEEALGDAIRRRLGVQVRVGPRIAGIRHAIMNSRIAGSAFACRIVGGRVRPRDYNACRWVRVDEIGDLPITGSTRKYLRALALPVGRGTGRG